MSHRHPLSGVNHQRIWIIKAITRTLLISVVGVIGTPLVLQQTACGDGDKDACELAAEHAAECNPNDCGAQPCPTLAPCTGFNLCFALCANAASCAAVAGGEGFDELNNCLDACFKKSQD